MRVHKIVSVSVVILLVTVLLAGAVTVPAAAQYDWMQYQYNAAHTGDYSPVAGTVPSNGQLKWTYTTGGDVFGSSPAVVNGVVYIVGSSNVYALNANNGQKLWTYAAETGGFASAWNGASPAVVNGVVYVGSNDGNVYALNANNGHKLWNYTIGGASSSPAVANGVVYVTSLEGALNIYALNANNGHKLWNYSSGNRVFVPGLLSTPAVANGVVYVGARMETFMPSTPITATSSGTSRLEATLFPPLQSPTALSTWVGRAIPLVGSNLLIRTPISSTPFMRTTARCSGALTPP